MPLNHRLVHRSVPKMTTTDLPGIMMMNDSNCAICAMGPPPNLILSIPPPPIPSFLQYGSEVHSQTGMPISGTVNGTICNHHCDWKVDGVQYVEMPHQVAGNLFDDTWLLILVLSCVGIIVVSVLLVIVLLRCKFNTSQKGGTISMPAAAITQPKSARIQNETVLYPCTADGMQDSRIMWATLTPRGTTRHYLEDHTYETVGNGMTPKRTYPTAPVENIYIEPPVSSPVRSTPKEEIAFDNTAFVDYEEPLSMKAEYFQLNDVLEPNESELYGCQRETYRPRVSSPTRIEHPNLPPLNLHPHNRTIRKNSSIQQIGADTILRNSLALAAYTPDI
ncbi:uncharacterized protein LOC135160599 isoform X2 [Diachasmimorpha longicaudata]|uniref:uncharacterized protein LOC135160599 isoform X2 n=1 Tax=Diachasmimorpha longicaudata TaxID=58733 RepID=UPI0030B88F19